ncbi:hypothetical protein EVA_15847 [gut metagenome]|uniref:Uncharacterized protein n=1 Tax=gut metagenome TaxID=749906 RepID=J9C877_9ZZZZ
MVLCLSKLWEDLNPNLTTTIHITSHCDTCSFNLVTTYISTFISYKTIRTKS